MAKKGKTRIYWRERGGEARAYGDFRDYSDVGGGREALKPEGCTRATTDPEVAEKLAADRVEELREARRNRTLYGIEREVGIAEFADAHLKKKARAKDSVSESWLGVVQGHLEAAAEFFGPKTTLNAIRPEDVERWIAHLRRQPNGMGGTLSESSIRKYINSLSNLYRRAQKRRHVPPDYNPVAMLLPEDKPQAHAGSAEANWLEVHEAALYLEAARRYEPSGARDTIPFIYPLVATFLLTGGRKSEVLGLAVEDVSFDRNKVTFEPNEHRRLKTKTSHRAVPLWPQLRQVLQEYVFSPEGPKSGLLFPSPRSGKMLKDLRKLLDGIGKRIGLSEGDVRTKDFRHTYCAARLQTFDGYREVLVDEETGETRREGIPVTKYTVAQEMGHGGTNLVDRVYGHLGEIRHRSDVVEYRTENHREELGERLVALQAKG